jgi:membrane-bound ClpP family serine protease
VYTNNKNRNNYFVWQQVTDDDNVTSLEALATTVIYAGDSSPYNTTNSLDNIEVKKINNA